MTTKLSLVSKSHLNDAKMDFANGNPELGTARINFVNYLVGYSKGNLNMEMSDEELEYLWDKVN